MMKTMHQIKFVKRLCGSFLAVTLGAMALPAAEATAVETLEFVMAKVPVDHQGPQVIDLEVALVYAAGIGPKEYPDFEVIYRELGVWMKDYPNETDYWEVFNKALGQKLLAAYPMVTEVTLAIVVHPTFGIQYSHTSRCTLTRKP